jgi:hypothetical protein
MSLTNTTMGGVMKKINKLATMIFIMLGMQYILGMVTALFRSDDLGQQTLLGSTALILHSILGLGIVIHTIMCYFQLIKSGNPKLLKVGNIGNLSTIISLLAGGATVSLHETAGEIASLLMALSFLVAFACYGYIAIVTKNIQVDQDKIVD